MRALLCNLMVCGGVVWVGNAAAAPKGNAPPPPKVEPQQQEQLAAKHVAAGEYEPALAAAEEGLAAAPKHEALLYLKADVLLRMNDHPRALDAYEAFLKVARPGARQREAKKSVASLRRKVTTFLDITVAGGPADIHVGLRTKRVHCLAETSCKKAVSPGDHKVTVERPGFARWTERVTVASGTTQAVTVTLTELPSPLAVRVAPPGARITVDGAPYDAKTPVAPGPHKIEVSLDGHEPATLEAIASEGKPIALDVTLARLVPVRVAPPGAELLLDGAPAMLRDGHLVVRPGPHELVVRARGLVEQRIRIPAEPAPAYEIAVHLQPPPAPRRGLTLRRKLALASGGAGLAALGTGLALGRQIGQLEANAFTLCPVPGSPCLYSAEATAFIQRAQGRALQANLAFGLAGGAALAAAVLWLTGAPESRVAVTPRLGATAGLDLAVRF